LFALQVTPQGRQVGHAAELQSRQEAAPGNSRWVYQFRNWPTQAGGGIMRQRVQLPVYRTTGRFLSESVEGLVVSTVVLLTWFVSKRWLANFGSVSSERAGSP